MRIEIVATVYNMPDSIVLGTLTMYNTITGFGFPMIAKLSRPRFVLPASADNTYFINSRYYAQPHPIIVKYLYGVD